MKPFQKVRHIVRTCLIIFMLLILSIDTYGGYKTKYHFCWGCSNTYEVWTRMDYLQNTYPYVTHLCSRYDHDAVSAYTSCYYFPFAVVDVARGALVNYTINWTLNFHYIPGNAFIFPSVITGDTLGIARSEIWEKEESMSSNGNATTVTLYNFAGALAAKINTQFGSSYRVVVWRKDFGGDSVLTPQKVLWDGSIRIENGQVVPTGGFQLSDFNITTAYDTLGYQVIKVSPIAGLVKTINVNFPGSDTLTVVTTAGDVGFGTYDPTAIFQPNVNNIPTLSQWGLLIFGIMLLTVGVVFIVRRKRLMNV